MAEGEASSSTEELNLFITKDPPVMEELLESDSEHEEIPEECSSDSSFDDRKKRKAQIARKSKKVIRNPPSRFAPKRKL